MMFGGSRKWKMEYENLEKKYLELLRKNQTVQKQLGKLEREQEEALRQKGEITQLHESARRLKHDMRNHLMVVASFLNQGEIEEAKSYVSQILDKLNLDYSYISTGNALLNYIVNEKINAAKEQGIYVKAEIENLKFEGVESIDFSAVLGNLLDNAIEAAVRSEKRYVEIVIRRQRGYEMIRVCNSIDASVLGENPNLETTKVDAVEHGIGILQVRRIVEKYEGMLDIYEEDKRFIVAVLF